MTTPTDTPTPAPVSKRWALLDFRRTRGIRQQDLAVLLNLSKPMVGRIESGQAQPTAQITTRFAEVFNVTPDAAEAVFAMSERVPDEDEGGCAVRPHGKTRRPPSVPEGVLSAVKGGG